MLHVLEQLTDYSGEWAKVPAQLCGSHGSLREGLYALIFVNPTNEDIYDNNKVRKIVVHQSGVSVKPGKFEQKLLARVNNYNAHLHWRGNDGALRWALQECFVGGYVLDLSDHNLGARIFERYWNESVNHFLRVNGLLAEEIPQIARAEWRYVARHLWTDLMTQRLKAYLTEVASRIHQMASVAKFPML